MEDFWALDQSGKSFLNRREFVDIVSDVYNIEPAHFVAHTALGKMGVPLFLVRRPFSRKKLTSMAFNFYPPLVGVDDDSAALQAIAGKAMRTGDNCLIEYKTFGRIDDELAARLGLRVDIASVVSDLPLPDIPEQRWSGYKSQHRTNLRALIKNHGDDLSLAWGDMASLKIWFGVLQDVYRRKHHMITQPFTLFRRLMASGLGGLLVATERTTGRLLGGIFILKDENKWEYSWGATSDYGQKKGVAHLLLDHAIAEAITVGVDVFGFGSSPTSDNNLRFFKTRWGAQEKNIYYVVSASCPPPLNLENAYGPSRALIFPRMPKAALSCLSRVAVKVLS